MKTWRLEDYAYKVWFKEKESYDKTLEVDQKEEFNDLRPLESDEEVKEGKRTEILTLNKLLRI